ncbi:MAG TPA: response regulator transcription factor [Anaerolineales bacterium]|nr:response regulator transcription factor [Anaerolineales bacterium]
MLHTVTGRIRILLIDDDIRSLELLRLSFVKDGYEVMTASSGAEGLRQAYNHHPDAILLDRMMPGMEGLEVCRRLREMTDAVIVFLSVKGVTDDVVRGLQSGADDYVVKPCKYAELKARLEACLRRRSAAAVGPPVRLAGGEAFLVADPSRRLVFINGGRSVQLTPKEFELLEFLIRNRGRVLSAATILANVWGPGYEGERDLVKQFIHRLRAKLEADPARPGHIVTIRGSGYSLEEETKPIRRPDESAEAGEARSAA